MTGHYTHTRPQTQRDQIAGALAGWAESLAIAAEFAKGGAE